MPLHQRIVSIESEIIGWRRSLHARPELLYEVEETAAFVAEKLRAFGCDVVETGIGRTGVVGVIRGTGPGRSITLRSDMDALPIEEETGTPYASQKPGMMHACGHDGHMAMLLGAARHLCETRDFSGTVNVVFQPAEEGGAGARAMIEDGLFERFETDAVYGMHNLPGMPVGSFGVRPGPIMASTDEFTLTVDGRGGHAAIPQLSRDPILAGSALVQALQQVVARNVDPLDSLVLSVTQFHAGFVHNVIPDTAEVSGTVRSLSANGRALAETRIREICAGIAAAHGVAIEVEYDRNYPVTMNDAAEAARCGEIAAAIAGIAQVDFAAQPLMAGEDFSYMLEKRPGAFVFIGNGPSASLHNARYDFDDRALVYGASYWVELAKAATRA
ncbi:M20 aminoacylase family protein [Aureimonas mangrovi]|uniref:M20 aminoacylase family protein n=1 Tax=Aureimonas mangrovi TaxID=2758041 RepID=UPI00163DC33F|nr:M20 aminoacylase family protein [Aureimonas mangrovi]